MTMGLVFVYGKRDDGRCARKCCREESVGVVGGMLEQFGYLAKSQVLVNIGIVSSLIMPVDSVYRKIVYTLSSVQGPMMALYMGPFGSGAEPSAWMLFYTGLYILGFLLLALRIFSRRDI